MQRPGKGIIHNMPLPCVPKAVVLGENVWGDETCSSSSSLAVQTLQPKHRQTDTHAVKSFAMQNWRAMQWRKLQRSLFSLFCSHCVCGFLTKRPSSCTSMCRLSHSTESYKKYTYQVFKLIAQLFFSFASVHFSFPSCFLKGGLFTFSFTAFPLWRTELRDEQLQNSTAGLLSTFRNALTSLWIFTHVFKNTPPPKESNSRCHGNN